MTMKNTTAALAAAAALGIAGAACANNLQVSNVAVSKRDDHTAFVTFNITWQNSWRVTTINHDAAWVFFKVKPESSNDWQHVTLEGSGVNPADYSNGVGTAIDIIVPSDRVGLFVRRAADGEGTVAVTNVQAVWNFSSNSLVKTSKVFFQALAVEMVYVAQGNFKVGSGGGENTHFRTGGAGNNGPFEIASEAAITVANTAGNLYYDPGPWDSSDRGSPIPLGFPKGYDAFYCMKYETTQGQYTDFLNTLTPGQAGNRYAASSMTNRYTIGVSAAGAYTNGAPDRACNFMSWADGAAFADWAGLRPMTELEFEKACRGPQTPVANECAWGGAISGTTTAIVNDGAGTDTATGGNCNYDACTPDGPYRVGIYATGASTRAQAGASYWGIMELSGNLWEQVVSVGHPAGRAFTGQHGNGVLNAAGDADVGAWPGPTSAGGGARGGEWSNSINCVRVSDRICGANPSAARSKSFGMRGVRKAPSGVLP